MLYDDAPDPVRADLAAEHGRVLDRLARPGTWLDGAARRQVALEARHARDCALCARQKAALSPYAVSATHDRIGGLPAAWVEVIHRIVADPGRLTRRWSEGVRGAGLTDGEYVEIVSVIAHVTALDSFARALGLALRPLPPAQAGAPQRYRPAEARVSDAWVPTIAWDAHGPNEADYFVGPASNIRRALTLLPDEARSFFALSAVQYLSGPMMQDFDRDYRAITRAEIEFLAGRVSALNRCHY